MQDPQNFVKSLALTEYAVLFSESSIRSLTTETWPVLGSTRKNSCAASLLMKNVKLLNGAWKRTFLRASQFLPEGKYSL